jgi:hypothetical protein
MIYYSERIQKKVGEGERFIGSIPGEAGCAQLS